MIEAARSSKQLRALRGPAASVCLTDSSPLKRGPAALCSEQIRFCRQRYHQHTAGCNLVLSSRTARLSSLSRSAVSAESCIGSSGGSHGTLTDALLAHATVPLGVANWRRPSQSCKPAAKQAHCASSDATTSYQHVRRSGRCAAYQHRRIAPAWRCTHLLRVCVVIVQA